jgi:E3 ubiquitin-protein ligase MARCH6
MVLLLVELGVFPTLCGIWLDVCCLRLVGRHSLVGRLSFCHSSPLVCLLLHWVFGILYMLYISRLVR